MNGKLRGENMSGVIKCPNCKTPLFVAEGMIGSVMSCPTCQRPIQLVGQTQPIPASSAQPSSTASGSGAPVAAAAGKSKLPQAAPLAPIAPLAAAPSFSLEP